MIVMPAMSAPQAASWHGLMDLHERLDHGWTLIGGQLVHLHCAERDYAPLRPTDDIDTVLDVRAYPDMLEAFTGVLVDLGFRPVGACSGSRWRRPAWAVREQASRGAVSPPDSGDWIPRRVEQSG